MLSARVLPGLIQVPTGRVCEASPGAALLPTCSSGQTLLTIPEQMGTLHFADAEDLVRVTHILGGALAGARSSVLPRGHSWSLRPGRPTCSC